MLYFGACFYNAAEERNMPAGYTLSRAERDAVVADIVGVNLTCVFFFGGGGGTWGFFPPLRGPVGGPRRPPNP